jgi:very-short-patch-repair endonuclease
VTYTTNTLHHAKSMRSEMTEAEAKLWRLLRAKRLESFKFRRQQPIGPFIADFVCQSQRLIVEADGSQHADNAADAMRTAWLNERGYCVLRFWNADILQRSADVMATIYAALLQPLSPLAVGESPSPSRGEGKDIA